MLWKLMSDASWAEPIASGSLLRLPLPKTRWCGVLHRRQPRLGGNSILWEIAAENMAEQFRCNGWFTDIKLRWNNNLGSWNPIYGAV